MEKKSRVVGAKHSSDYNELARTAKLPGLKRTLHTLAQEEQTHAEMLRDLEDHMANLDGFAQWTAESTPSDDTPETLQKKGPTQLSIGPR